MMQRMRHVFLPALLVGALCSGGCSHPSGVTSLHDLHQPAMLAPTPTLESDFYALPFPNDVRISAAGTVDLSQYPRIGGIADQYLDIIGAELRGFGINAGVHFRFDGPIDPATLPADANLAMAPDATAFVVDVTAGSPTYGQRAPVTAHFSADRLQFIGPNWVALLPYPGFPLAEKTTYAAVLTDGIKSSDGKSVRRATDLDAVLRGHAGDDAKLTAAAKAYAPLTAWLRDNGGLADHVINATVFTTGDETSIMAKLRAAVYATPAPSIGALTDVGEDSPGVDHIYTGTYQGPNFQSGDPPYLTAGGAILFDPNGAPIVQRTETLRVAMTIPDAPMPAQGWPVVLYAHGTGGGYRSFIADKSARDAALVTAADGSTIARLAMISIDQPLHGPRDPTHNDPDLTSFNFMNLHALHDTLKQGGLDDFQLLRLVNAIDIAAAPGTGAPLKFDADHIYFKGHSQGSLTGGLFAPQEPQLKAVVLSGSSGNWLQWLLHKQAPIDVAGLLETALGEPIDQYHPLLNLIQAYMDDMDPESYGPLYVRRPPPGASPKSVFQSLGLDDHYAPIETIEALGLSIGLQPVLPMLTPIDGTSISGMSWAQAPVVGNLGPTVTGVHCQYPAIAGEGHYVIFHDPAAIAQSNRFLATHYQGGVARLDPP
jgi:hypothetical protein